METPFEHLQKIVNSLAKFKASVFVEVYGIIVDVELTCDQYGQYIHVYVHYCPGGFGYGHFRARTVEEAFQYVRSNLPGGKVHLSSLIVMAEPNYRFVWLGGHGVLRKSWAAALTENSETRRGKYVVPENVREELLAICKGDLKERMLNMLASGESGVATWNWAFAAWRNEFALLYWTESELSDLDLRGVRISSLKFYGANFSGSNLRNSNLHGSLFVKANFCEAILKGAVLDLVQADEADFSRASLRIASLRDANLKNCLFDRADLTGADLSRASLHGADLTTAVLTHARFDGAQYDESTKWPEEIPQWSKLRWDGKGKDPFRQHVEQEIDKADVSDFEGFINSLRLHIDSRRLDNVFQVLMKERFRIYFELEKTSIVGVLENPRHKGVIFACTLSEDGKFCCCTQDLNFCTGAKGVLCKHMLILIVALAKAGKLDLTATLRWILASQLQKPNLIKEICADILLKLYGVKVGENDWAPVLTVPEDYSSLKQ